MAKIGEISVAIVADTKKFKAGVDDAKKGLKGFGGDADKILGDLQKKFIQLAAGAAALGAVKWGVRLASDAEQANVAFKVLLGSQEKATKLISDIKTLSASTPLGQAELLDASKMLASFGEDANTIPETLRRIGDVSSAIGAPIGEIAELYGKARVQGRLFGEDINQLTGRGIPIISELAKQFGVAESEVKKLVETGKVNFGNLEQAFISLTSEGGKFGGMLVEQSKTFAGQWSTLKDNIAQIVLELANELLPVLKKVVDVTSTLVDKWGEFKTKSNEVISGGGPDGKGRGGGFTGPRNIARFIPFVGAGLDIGEGLVGGKEGKARRAKSKQLDEDMKALVGRRAEAEAARVQAVRAMSSKVVGDLTPDARMIGKMVGSSFKTAGTAASGSMAAFFKSAGVKIASPIESGLDSVRRGTDPISQLKDAFNPVELLGKARSELAAFVAANPNVLNGQSLTTDGATNSAALKGSEQAQRLINQQRVRQLGGDQNRVQKEQLDVLKKLLAAAEARIEDGQIVSIP